MTDEIPRLHPYQVAGSDWLVTRTLALLADEMGLGKSAQAIDAADRIGAERILVICPAVARINWLREFEKFSSFFRPITIITSRSDPLPPPNHSVICSYDLATTAPQYLQGHWDVTIADEIHFLKAADAARAKAILGSPDGVIRRSKRFWGLSGTPSPNGYPSELWILLYTFGLTPLTYTAFVERYCKYYQTRYGPKVTGANSQTLPELRALIKQCTLRRTKEEVMIDLPPITFSNIAVEASPVDLDLEQSFVPYVFPHDRREELKAKLAHEESLLKTVVENTGLGIDGLKALDAIWDSVSTLRRYTGIQKVPKLAELIKEELEANAYEKVIIFAIHRDVIEGLRSRLSKFKAVTLYGGTEPDSRQRNIDKFQNNPRCRVFVGNILACGTAITLTAANQVVFAEEDWVPGNNVQAVMRAHRIGQKNPVFVRVAGLAGSIDEKVAQVLKRKMKELSAIFNDS